MATDSPREPHPASTGEGLPGVRSAAAAATYRRKFSKNPLRRCSNRRELQLVAQALAALPGSGTVLDCPCGTGRLAGTLRGRATRLVGCDLSPAMVCEARRLGIHGHDDLLVASALRLPFADAAFDVLVCQRLVHHLRAREARRALLRELARVSRVGVVLSFADADSLKARLQRRGRSRSRRPITLAELEQDAAACGLRAVAPPRRIAGLFSYQAVVPLARLR